MSSNAIIATLTETPQSANDIAAKLGKPVSTVRKWLKKLRDNGDIAYQKVGSSIHYYLKAAVEAVTQAVETIREIIKPTRSELRSKVLARAESHRTKMLNSRSSAEGRDWKHRYLRATHRAAALAC